MKTLPKLVRTLMVNHGAWLVGSAASWYVGDTDALPADYDLLVPPKSWNAACRTVALVCAAVRFNSYGGIKAEDEGHMIDLWSGTLDDFFVPGHPDAKLAVRLSPCVVVRAT